MPVRGLLKDVPISSIACGNAHNLAVDANTGLLYAWGSNVLGQLGISPGLSDQLLPARVCLDKAVEQVSAGSYHSVALTKDKTLYSFGHAEYGQHGEYEENSTTQDFRHLSRHFFTPQVVNDFQPDCIRLKSVHCGQQFTSALDEQGQLWTWGFGAFGNLGHGHLSKGNFPQRVEGLIGHALIEVSAGHQHVLVLTNPVGHPFALKNSLSSYSDFDCEIFGSKIVDGGLKCHRAIVLTRCPSLGRYFTTHGTCVLSRNLERRVLIAFLEYIYCDVVRSCPPHRLKDLEELATDLNLPRLAGLCSLQRYQRKVKDGLQFLDPNPITKIERIPPSSFVTDMLNMLKSSAYCDGFLASSDYLLETEQSVPVGHTRFSWFNRIPSKESFVGHTNFSKGISVGFFPIHRFILSRYPFFNILLTGSFKEGLSARSGEVIRLDSIPDGETLQALLEWIYSGSLDIQLSGDNVSDIVQASHTFGIDDLTRYCESYLLEVLDKENVVNILTLALDNDLTKVVKECEYVLNQDKEKKVIEEEEE